MLSAHFHSTVLHNPTQDPNLSGKAPWGVDGVSRWLSTFFFFVGALSMVSYFEPKKPGEWGSFAAGRRRPVSGLIRFVFLTEKLGNERLYHRPPTTYVCFVSISFFFFFLLSARNHAKPGRVQVRFLRPLEDDGGKDFFNVFVLHQARREENLRGGRRFFFMMWRRFVA